jgi:hypothetical protein
MCVCESVASVAQAFLGNVLTIGLKKSAVTEPSYARYGADNIGPRVAAHDSFHSGGLKDRARRKRGGHAAPYARSCTGYGFHFRLSPQWKGDRGRIEFPIRSRNKMSGSVRSNFPKSLREG